MSRRLSAVILAGMFAMMSVPSSVQAESQAGGLPGVSDRVRVLEGIAVNLQTAVTTLQSNVTTLKTTVTNLQTNVTTLQTKVTTLETKNTDLQGALDAEIASRVQGDNALRAAVDSERVQRTAGDSSLADAIDTIGDLVASTGQFYETVVVNTFLVEGASATLATLGPLPAGNYLVTATLGLENTIHAARWLCTLFAQTGDQVPVAVIDSLQTHTSLGGIGVLSEFNSVALAGIARVPQAAASVKVNCGTGVSGSDVRSVRIVAVKLGQPGL